MKKWIGYVHIKLVGLDIERQIQKILSCGVVLNHCVRQSLTSFTAWVRPWHIKRIKKLGVQVKLMGSGGAAKRVASGAKRWGIIAGALLWLTFILLIQGRVFVVNVSGATPELNQELLKQINSTALIGQYMNGNLLEQLERQIASIPSVQWASVTQKGINLEITVKQKPEMPVGDPQQPGDIVATKVGLLQSITVLQGMPVASEGKLVLPGDVIISGQLIYAGKPASYIAAMGECTAKVWYSAEKEVSLTCNVSTPTGRTFVQKSVCIMDMEFGGQTPPFENYSVTEIKKPLASMGVPVYTVERTYAEQQITTQKITPEQALQQHKAELEAEIKSVLPNCELLELSFYTHLTNNGVVVGVSAVTLEDIGTFVSR